MTDISVIILGSGTGVPTPDRGAASYLIKTERELMMFDCGPGSTRKLAQAGYQLTDLDRVFISHFHPDHINDLTAILFGLRIPGFQRTGKLELIGPVGLKAHYEKLLALFGRWIESVDYQLEIIELAADQIEAEFELLDGRLTARLMAHSYPALGFRIATSAGVIVYSGDTDYCHEIVALSQQADLAILECSTPDELKIKSHLTPGLAGRIAAEAGIKHLVLSHFYPSCQNADILGQCRRVFAGRITLAHDLMQLRLE